MAARALLAACLAALLCVAAAQQDQGGTPSDRHDHDRDHDHWPRPWPPSSPRLQPSPRPQPSPKPKHGPKTFTLNGTTLSTFAWPNATLPGRATTQLQSDVLKLNGTTVGTAQWWGSVLATGPTRVGWQLAIEFTAGSLNGTKLQAAGTGPGVGSPASRTLVVTGITPGPLRASVVAWSPTAKTYTFVLAKHEHHDDD